MQIKKNTVKITARKKVRYPRKFINTVKITARKKVRYPRKFIKLHRCYFIYPFRSYLFPLSNTYNLLSQQMYFDQLR